jgi:Flp pilus assembly protein TadD
MPGQRRTGLFSVLAVALAVGSGLAYLGWLAVCHPDIRFLAEAAPAEWIVYPSIAWPNGRPIAEQEAVFRRSFVLDKVPKAARLGIRSFTAGQVRLNGAEMPLMPGGEHNWKEENSADIAGQLRGGRNDLAVTVTNRTGPPALWLWLAGDGFELHTDEQWEAQLCGSWPRPARLARDPVKFGPGNLLGGGEQPLSSLAACWPTLLAFAAVSLATAIGMEILRRRPALPPLVVFWLSPRGCLVAVAFLWLLLLLHNLAALPFAVGHDHEAHLGYIRYIQERQALPLADEGVEMHQPPLYYLLGAATLDLAGLRVTDPGAVALLRWLSLLLALVNCGLLLASLRLLFPGQPRPQIVGFILGAFLPAQLCLAHYPTNELLLGTMGTASIYLCLRILGSEELRSGPYVLLGVCLGAALLSKVTALVLAVVVTLVVVGRLFVRGEHRAAFWLRTVGVMVAVCLVVCGWHYWRVTSRFGTPLASSFDGQSGFRWWMAPGYATRAYLFRFGSVLNQPFFSVLHGFPDGLYSTLWGDGLWGGAAGRAGRPPWRYDLMAAGYWLALVWTAAAAAGGLAAAIRFIRRPGSRDFLLVGVAAGLGLALVYHFLRYPYLCHAKAFYALSGLVPLAAFAAWGYDSFARRHLVWRLLAATVLGTWALCAYASVWVSPDCAETQYWVARHLRDAGRVDQAAAYLQQALEEHPHDARLLLTYGDLLFDAGDNDGARRLMELAVQAEPDWPGPHLTLSLLFEREKRLPEAIAEARRATELAPEDTRVWPALARLLSSAGDNAAAEEALRRALSVTPDDWNIHHQLEMILASKGRTREAQEARDYAERLQPSKGTQAKYGARE